MIIVFGFSRNVQPGVVFGSGLWFTQHDGCLLEKTCPPAGVQPHFTTHPARWLLRVTTVVVMLLGLWLTQGWTAMDIPTSAPLAELESTMRLSLEQAVLTALERNPDISVSRDSRAIRMTDILFEQAKFDPTVLFSGRYDRSVIPLNRPIFGLNELQTRSDPDALDQIDATARLGFSQLLPSGGTIGFNLDAIRSSVAGDASGFLFNPGYEGSFSLDLSQPLLRNFGVDVNYTRIQLARNSAHVEKYAFWDQVLNTVMQVEQAYWELVFARENLGVAQANHRAAQELLISNRAKVKGGIMTDVEVLQAKASVAARVEDMLVARQVIRDRQDQLRQLLSGSADALTGAVRVVPEDRPGQWLNPMTFQEAIRLALRQRPEIARAQTTLESRDLSRQFAKNQLLPDVRLQGMVGLRG